MYNKTEWKDNVTPVNASNLNKLETTIGIVVEDLFYLDEELENKVDKVDGKTLSTNDFTNSYKEKLEGLKNADVNKEYVDSELTKKANKEHTHSEYLTEIPEHEHDLSNYYNKQETYNKTEIGEIVDNSTSTLATKEELKQKANTNHDHNSLYANKSSEHTHTNKTILDGITQTKVNEWNNKEVKGHKHSYNDLTDTPVIPTVDVTRNYVDTELDKKSDKTHNHNYNDLTNKPTIPTSTNQLTNDSNFATENYVTNKIAEASLGGSGNIDISGLATKEELNQKADKNHEHDELHSHSNIALLNSINSQKIDSWDNKSEFSGNYLDLENKPTIPNKVSQLTNDRNFATEDFVVEKVAEASLSGGEVDLSHLATKEELYLKSDLDHTHTELHTHSNASALNAISSSKISEWDSKSTFDGDYNSLTNRPTIPTPIEIVNNLTSTDTNKGLSANQGKVLKEYVDKSIYFKGIIDNANNATTTGFYKCQQGCANIPVNEYSFLIVYNEPNQTTSIQIWYSVITNKQRIRRIANGSFGSWYTVFTSEEKPTLEELGASSSTHTHNELHTHSNKDVLDGITASNITAWNNKLSSETYSFSQDRVADANNFKTNGYAKTSSSTANLPEGKSDWGVIQFVAENSNVGQQIYYLCSGEDKGRIYVRNLLNGAWSDWNRLAFESDLNASGGVDFAGNHTWTGTHKFTRVMTLEKDNEVQRMQPYTANASCYYSFYKNKTNRSGHFGYGSTNNNHFQIANELSGGNLNLTVNGGEVQYNGQEVSTKQYVDNQVNTINESITNINNTLGSLNSLLDEILGEDI